MNQYDITPTTPAGTFIKARIGERFSIRMPEVQGRIVEPALGHHRLVEHTCRTEGPGFVMFDMVALSAGSELIEFPLIDPDWDGGSDPDPTKAESYTEVLVVVLGRTNFAERQG